MFADTPVQPDVRHWRMSITFATVDLRLSETRPTGDLRFEVADFFRSAFPSSKCDHWKLLVNRTLSQCSESILF